MSEIPYGYCQCGCGQRTKLAIQTNRANGWIKGQPVRYIHGHSKFLVRGKRVHPIHIPARPIAERFWEKVQKQDGNSCWMWKGRRNNKGYGMFDIRNKGRLKIELAHRTAWRLSFGPIPQDKPLICHHCDNPGCCNPTHLFAGSSSDNLKDAATKGRLKTPRKLTQVQVSEIRRLAARGMLQREIAPLFHISNSQISRIVNRVDWRF